MQNNSLVQIKLKANQFIEDYQRQVTQRQYQKQKLKQNIMLEIMSNRHKSQVSQSISNDLDRIDNITQEDRFKKSVVGSVGADRKIAVGLRSNSVPNANNGEPLQANDSVSAQITFKMSKKNTFNYFEYAQEPKEESAEQEPESSENCLDDNETLRQGKKTATKINEEEGRSKLINTRNDKQKDEGFQKSQRLRSQYHEQKYNNEQEEDSQTERRENIEEQIQITQQKPIFLTLDEDQSVEMSHENKNKNYAFDIALDKPEPIDDIEELRKRKIQELERKRQQRMDQFRRLEENKRLNSQEKQKTQKRSGSFVKPKPSPSIPSINSKIEIESEQENPKSKSRRKIPNLEEKLPSIVHDSHYNMKPPQPQRSSYMGATQERDRNEDNLQTPKTILSEHRVDKSKGKGSIFRESPKRAGDKSMSKYSQDPKIEPKQRKNTFVKQSNKKLLITALTNICLPGQLNRKEREKLTDVIERQPSQFLVLLFKQYSRKVIKAIYSLDASQQFLIKIYGEKSPQEIFAENVKSFYRFDSGSRQFKQLDGCKSFSLVVHAIDLA